VQIGANGDAIFKRFMYAIGREDLAEDPALADNAGRDTRRDELYQVIDRWAASLNHEQALEILAAANVPASRILSIEDMFLDPQFIARGMFIDGTLPNGRNFKMPGIVPKLSTTPGTSEWTGPALGEHTEEILEELGYTAQDIGKLRKQKII